MSDAERDARIAEAIRWLGACETAAGEGSVVQKCIQNALFNLGDERFIGIEDGVVVRRRSLPEGGFIDRIEQAVSKAERAATAAQTYAREAEELRDFAQQLTNRAEQACSRAEAATKHRR